VVSAGRNQHIWDYDFGYACTDQMIFGDGGKTEFRFPAFFLDNIEYRDYTEDRNIDIRQ
jgi:hypothetical protein